jgi:hypothetical protein
MKYGITFWSNSTDSKSVCQKRNLRDYNIDFKARISGKPLFKALEILTLPSLCILFLMTFLVLILFTRNFLVRIIDTRMKGQLLDH